MIVIGFRHRPARVLGGAALGAAAAFRSGPAGRRFGIRPGAMRRG